MSQDKRENAEQAKEHVEEASRQLRYAGEYAKRAGDKTLVEQVQKVRTDADNISKELTKKLDPEKG